MRVPEPGVFQLVTDAPGVRESRPLHLAGNVLAKRRFRFVGEVVARLLQHHLPDGYQLVEFVRGARSVRGASGEAPARAAPPCRQP